MYLYMFLLSLLSFSELSGQVSTRLGSATPNGHLQGSPGPDDDPSWPPVSLQPTGQCAQDKPQR